MSPSSRILSGVLVPAHDSRSENQAISTGIASESGKVRPQRGTDRFTEEPGPALFLTRVTPLPAILPPRAILLAIIAHRLALADETTSSCPGDLHPELLSACCART